MKHKSEKILHQAKSLLYIFCRRAAFKLKKPKNGQVYFSVKRDETFRNSLIEINYYFAGLLYIEFPKIGRRLYNGRILLAADKLSFPYRITAHTAFGRFENILEQEAAPQDFRSTSFILENLQGTSGILHWNKTFRMPLLEAVSKEIHLSRMHAEMKIRRQSRLKIDLTRFKTEDFI